MISAFCSISREEARTRQIIPEFYGSDPLFSGSVKCTKALRVSILVSAGYKWIYIYVLVISLKIMREFDPKFKPYFWL